MRHTQYCRTSLKANRNLNGEVLVWLIELYTVVEELPLVRASIQDASEPVDGTFTGVLSAVVQRDPDTDLSRARECAGPNDCYGDVRACLKCLPGGGDGDVDTLGKSRGSEGE